MGYGSILNQSFETSPVLDNYFTKDESLTSNTAALYGLSGSAVPDDVLKKARELITAAQNTANGKARVVTGTYTGNGAETQDINVGFQPIAVLVVNTEGAMFVQASPSYYYGGLALRNNPVFLNYRDDSQNVVSITSSGFRVYYATSVGSWHAYIYSNLSGATMYYMAIG